MYTTGGGGEGEQRIFGGALKFFEGKRRVVKSFEGR